MAYKGSRRGFGEIYRYVLSDVCLCAKAYVLYANGANMWIMSSELGSVSRDMPRVPVCFSASFCGLNLRTVPQLSVKKFRVPLGYRRLVLGLKVGKPKRVCFSLGTLNGARGEHTQPNGSRDVDYVTCKNWGLC